MKGAIPIVSAYYHNFYIVSRHTLSLHMCAKRNLVLVFLYPQRRDAHPSWSALPLLFNHSRAVLLPKIIVLHHTLQRPHFNRAGQWEPCAVAPPELVNFHYRCHSNIPYLTHSSHSFAMARGLYYTFYRQQPALTTSTGPPLCFGEGGVKRLHFLGISSPAFTVGYSCDFSACHSTHVHQRLIFFKEVISKPSLPY